MKLILGLTGEKASGKGTVAAYLKERYGASSYRFSDILTTTLKIYGLPISRPNQIKLFEILSEAFGSDVLARAMRERAADDANAIVVVDGVRRMDDIKYLRELSGFHIVYVTAYQRLRYERSVARNEKADESELTFDEFAHEEATASTEITIPGVAAQAEIKIENNGTKEELFEKIGALVAKIH